MLTSIACTAAGGGSRVRERPGGERGDDAVAAVAETTGDIDVARKPSESSLYLCTDATRRPYAMHATITIR